MHGFTEAGVPANHADREFHVAEKKINLIEVIKKVILCYVFYSPPPVFIEVQGST